jgi:hypothetical protein
LLVKQYFSRIHPQDKELAELPGTYFIKIPYAPLKQYMIRRYGYEDAPEQFKAWGIVSPIYSAYGAFLITHYFIPFCRYYLLLNAKNYFIPFLEKFDSYNLMSTTVPPQVQNWFDYTTPDIRVVSPTLQGRLFFAVPSLFMVLNIYFAASMIWLTVTGRLSRYGDVLRKGLLFVSFFLLVNFGFSVFATPVVLRYQVVPLILLFAFSLQLFQLREDPQGEILPAETN